MHRQIQLNDAAAWESLRPGQFVVFLSDPHSDVLLDVEGSAAGEATAVPVFENMEEAERYAEQSVVRLPSMCASIYDHLGRSGDPLKRVYHESIRKHFDPARSARRSAWVGGCFLGAFVIWAVIAAFSTDEHFLWFYILGMKLLTFGTILFVRGLGYFLGKRGK